MLHFFDFEVFKYDWLVVIINPVNKTEEIVVNDNDKLAEYYEKHKHDIWVGFNSRHYDQYILKGLLCEFDPKKISDYIINKKKPGWRYSSLFRNITLINYDVRLNNDGSLKSFEGYMGNSIKESSVPFDIDRPLTDKEIKETINYCKYDVEQTIEIFSERKEEFEASRELIRIFKLPVTSYGKTKAQLVSEILGGMGKTFDDNEFHFPIVSAVFDNLKKYRFVLDWYRNSENHDYSKNLECIIAGVPHTFAWGGIHGANKKNTVSGVLLNIDVSGYYPGTQITYKFGYRNMAKPENFELIHNENLRYKALGDKKARLPFKIADNSVSGQLKAKFSKLYDPMMNNAVCVNGQLMLLLLIEMVEPHVELIQSNTDGLLLKLNSIDDYELIDDIVYEWEQLTGMEMDFELFNKVYQKDVNNYLLIGDDGKIKSKGAYVKKLSRLDYDLPIVNKALVSYMAYEVPVEQTIYECDDLIEFQNISKISYKYKHILYGNKILKERCIRIFASKNKKDPGVKKVSVRTGRPEKISNSPNNCFIFNESVNGVKVPDKLDKDWYVQMAKSRLEDFGVIT